MVQLLGLNDTHKKQARGRMLQNSKNTFYGTQNLKRLRGQLGYAGTSVSLEKHTGHHLKVTEVKPSGSKQHSPVSKRADLN